MAFSKTPNNSTYQTKDVKFLWALDNRKVTAIKDTMATNGFFEITKNPATKDDIYTFNKRDGIATYMATIPSSNIRGIYFWEDFNKLLVAYDDKLDIIVASTGTVSTNHAPFTTTTGVVGFSEFNYDDGSTKVVVGDGTVLFTVDAADAVVYSTSPDLVAFLPEFVVLDGYLFMVKKDTQDIYNSDLGDPLAWTAGNFITAEMIPDQMIRISRLSNYLLAFGTNSVEYFFDAGNADGSPLQRNDTPVKHVGFLGGFAAYSNTIYFVGQGTTTAPELFMLEDFKMESIPSPILRRNMQTSPIYTATIISQGGHDYYVLTANNVTYMMDLETRVWTRQFYQNTATLAIQYSCMIPISGTGFSSVFSIKDTTGLFWFNRNTFQDNGVSYPVEVQTPKLLFETKNEKYMSRLIPVADRVDGTLNISWSDDDYTTFSTPREVSLNIERPMLHRLGRFVERAFKLSYTGNTALRMYYMTVDLNLGLK